MRRALPRRLLALIFGATGTLTVMGTVILMNQGQLNPRKPQQREGVVFDVQAPPKPPPAAKPKPKPKPKARRSAPPPAPMLAASLSGLGFGLDNLDGAFFEADADALLGDVNNVVMTEQTVDVAPKCVATTALTYPARARSRGLEGHVLFSLVVSAEGRISDITVLESDPPGVFEDSAKTAISAMRCEPATYQGRPVRVRIQKPVRFELES